MREGVNGVDGVDGVDSIDAVYDVTVAYNKPYHSVHIGETFPPTVVQLLSANKTSPKEIHFHITRHPIKNIPIRAPVWRVTPSSQVSWGTTKLANFTGSRAVLPTTSTTST